MPSLRDVIEGISTLYVSLPLDYHVIGTSRIIAKRLNIGFTPERRTRLWNKECLNPTNHAVYSPLILVPTISRPLV